MWESVVSISKVYGKAVGSFIPVGSSMDRHFLRPVCPPPVLRGEPQFLKQFVLGLLHASCRIGVAECSGDAFQGVDAEPLAQILCRLVERQQGFQGV